MQIRVRTTKPRTGDELILNFTVDDNEHAAVIVGAMILSCFSKIGLSYYEVTIRKDKEEEDDGFFSEN